MMRWARDWKASGTSTEREMFSRIAFCISSSPTRSSVSDLRVLVLGHRAGEAADPPRGDRRQDQDDESRGDGLQHGNRPLRDAARDRPRGALDNGERGDEGPDGPDRHPRMP